MKEKGKPAKRREPEEDLDEQEDQRQGSEKKQKRKLDAADKQMEELNAGKGKKKKKGDGAEVKKTDSTKADEQAGDEEQMNGQEKKKKKASKEQQLDDSEPRPRKKKQAEGEIETMKEIEKQSRREEQGSAEVIVSGADSSNPKYKPVELFSDAKLPEKVLKCCSNFAKPSPIQAHSWPFLLDGRDLIGIAATGSGKTLAFGVPAVMKVLENGKMGKSRQPICLVLAPTRELAQQISVVLEEAGAESGVKVACLYGGTSKGPQKGALKSGPAIVVATPGRLQDLVDEGVCDLRRVSYLVLDEADRMLDLGFEPAVRSIMEHLSKERQTIMFSATWPVAVEQLAKEFIQDPDPVKITVGSQDLTANHDVTQIVEVIDDRARDARLHTLLQTYHKSRKNRVLVFVLYKKEAARVESVLERKGWKVKAIHGEKSQEARNQALAAFRDGTHPLLIATDVAARGLDIPDVEYVINYSFPLTTEDYVHRIGRTGRAGKKGTAHTFFTTFDKARAGELVNILNEASQPVPDDLLKFGTHVKKKESQLYGAHFKELGPNAPKAQKITFGSDDDEE